MSGNRSYRDSYRSDYPDRRFGDGSSYRRDDRGRRDDRRPPTRPPPRRDARPPKRSRGPRSNAPNPRDDNYRPLPSGGPPRKRPRRDELDDDAFYRQRRNGPPPPSRRDDDRGDLFPSRAEPRRGDPLSNLPKGPAASRPAPKRSDFQGRSFKTPKKAVNRDSVFQTREEVEEQRKKDLEYPGFLPRELHHYMSMSSREKPVYEREQQVGEGTYGKVYKAKNSITGKLVALKRLRLENEKDGFPLTAMREIGLMQSFQHPNIIGLTEMMVEKSFVYMIIPYMNHDLTGLLTHPEVSLTDGHRKNLFKQLTEGLSYLHFKRIIHRDIKGSNLLIDNEGVLKITDFGLARVMKDVKKGIESPDYTNRVITLWYRPPELLLGTTDYGREVDVWGIGCLLVELYAKSAIFQGMDEILQLKAIFEIMGTPSIETWPGLDYLPWYELMKPQFGLPNVFRETFKTVVKSENCIDLAEQLLSMNPANRISAKQALQHPYFVEDPQPEPLLFLKELSGEWHEFESKKRRRREKEDERKARENDV